MTTKVQEATTHRPINRTARLLWSLLAVIAIAATVTAVVLVTTGSAAQPNPAGTGNGGAHGHVTTNQCVPSRYIHPC